MATSQVQEPMMARTNAAISTQEALHDLAFCIRMKSELDGHLPHSAPATVAEALHCYAEELEMRRPARGKKG